MKTTTIKNKEGLGIRQIRSNLSIIAKIVITSELKIENYQIGEVENKKFNFSFPLDEQEVNGDIETKDDLIVVNLILPKVVTSKTRVKDLIYFISSSLSNIQFLTFFIPS